jgi:dienelactone hydrolase
MAISRTIRRSEWPAFFPAFTAQHLGWLVRLDGVMGGRGELPLRAISMTPTGAIELHLASPGTGDRPTVHRVIADPIEVRIDERSDGAVEVLWGLWRAGGELSVRFAAVIAPELVDGVLPEEAAATERAVQIQTPGAGLDGDLTIPIRPKGLVLFAHGSGSSRFSPRNRFVASVLNEHGFATLLFDLLTPREEQVDQRSGHLRFDIALLAARLVDAIDWAAEDPDTAALALGIFGASTGAAAALHAASRRPSVRSVVARGGRPDLAGKVLGRVGCPVLLIVGERDEVVVDLNRQAHQMLREPKQLVVIPGATHLFPEPGTLDTVARLAARWFAEHLGRVRRSDVHAPNGNGAG